MENPQTGLMKAQPFMQNLPFKDIDYCKYGMPYRKRTRIWNNITSWTPRALCCRDCDSMDEHHKNMQKEHKDSIVFYMSFIGSPKHWFKKFYMPCSEKQAKHASAR